MRLHCMHRGAVTRIRTSHYQPRRYCVVRIGADRLMLAALLALLGERSSQLSSPRPEAPASCVRRGPFTEPG
jgi:hypothetical protein